MDERTGERPWAVVQLRTENLARSAYNLVGFQSRMKWPEQRRVFRMIPGLADAEFLRYGTVHRNTFINSPAVLGSRFELRSRPEILFAGQLTGVEGYVESMACGLLVALDLATRILEKRPVVWPAETALGALKRHVLGELAVPGAPFQPSNVNWSMFPEIDVPRKAGKKEKRRQLAIRGIARLGELQDAMAAQGLPLNGFSEHDPATAPIHGG